MEEKDMIQRFIDACDTGILTGYWGSFEQFMTIMNNEYELYLQADHDVYDSDGYSVALIGRSGSEVVAMVTYQRVEERNVTNVNRIVLLI